MSQYKNLEKNLSKQVKFWENQKGKAEKQDENKLPFITISREYGSGGYAIAEELLNILNVEYKSEPSWGAYDRKILDKVMNDMGISETLLKTLTSDAKKKMTNFFLTTFSKYPPQVAIFQKLVETIKILATNGNAIIIGRAGNAITKEFENGFHVKIVAHLNNKVEKVAKNFNVNKKEAERIIKEKSAERNSFVKEYIKFDTNNTHNFDLTINNSKYSNKEVAQIIVNAMKIRGFIKE